MRKIDQDTFAAKGTELRDRVAHLSLQIESRDRGRAELAEIAIKSLELSQDTERQMAFSRLSFETSCA